MKQNILGLDVGKASAVAFALDVLPGNISRFWKTLKSSDFYDLKCDRSGMQQLQAIAPSSLVLEPTGTHYSLFWVKAAEYLQIDLLWVGHLEVRHYRLSHRLPSKNDRSDAYALACYGVQHAVDPDRFVHFERETVSLRSALLELQSLHRIQVPIINRLRQQLAHEFPEAASKKSEVALWRWLSGESVGYYDRLYKTSVSRELDLELSSFTSGLARELVGLKSLERNTEEKLSLLLSAPCFQSYKQVFDRFGFGDRLSAAILVHSYPIERFGEWHGSTRCWNVKAFKLKLGMGLIEYSSGEKKTFAPGGSTLCRKLLYLWAVIRIASPVRRPEGDLAQDAVVYYEKLKLEMPSKQLARLRLCKVAARSCRVLFKELIQVTQSNP
jgi:hypothetical protein